MRYRKLTTTGDYSFGNGELDFYKDVPEAVAQAVKTRILLWAGEWYLNLESGTPFMQAILGKKSQVSADAALQDRIINTEGVTSIETFESTLNRETRHYTLSTTINTIYGPTKVEMSNYANI